MAHEASPSRDASTPVERRAHAPTVAPSRPTIRAFAFVTEWTPEPETVMTVEDIERRLGLNNTKEHSQ